MMKEYTTIDESTHGKSWMVQKKGEAGGTRQYSRRYVCGGLFMSLAWIKPGILGYLWSSYWLTSDWKGNGIARNLKKGIIVYKGSALRRERNTSCV